jgi:biotin operon repressor
MDKLAARNDRRWTDAELKKLIGLWLGGVELDAIAQEFGSTRYAVNKVVGRLRRDGVPLPRRNAGHRAGRRNALWTQAEVEYLFRRRNEKATAEQIAEELDRSFLAVQGMIQKLRQDGVSVRMLGQGTRRLWDADALRAAIAGRGLRVVGTDEEEAA